MLCLVCQFKVRTLPFLFDFFELKQRAHIRRKQIAKEKCLYEKSVLLLFWFGKK